MEIRFIEFLVLDNRMPITNMERNNWKLYTLGYCPVKPKPPSYNKYLKRKSFSMLK
jgi:hypothetical protein